MAEIGDSQLLNKELNGYCDELKHKINLNNKVLLINHPQFNLETFELDVAKNRGYYAYHPVGLECIAEVLLKRGFEVRILDLNFEFLKKANLDSEFRVNDWMLILKEYLEEYNPSVVGVTNPFNVGSGLFREILKFLMEEGKYVVIAGGQNATYNSETLLEKNLCHFVCQRESEKKINFLFDNLFENKDSSPTPGIVFKYGGRVVESAGNKEIVELRGNLIEAHKLLPIEDYNKYGSLSPYSRMAGRNLPFATILLNRGCEGACRFCGVRDYMGPGVRTRDIKEVLEEIEYLYNERGIRYIEWLDDDLTKDKKNVIYLLEEIAKKKLDLRWASNNGIIARTLDEEIMGKLRDSGCMGFKIGVESGNSEMLKKIFKTGNLDIFRNFSKLSQKFPEIFVVDNYIIGFPEETFRQMLDSFHFSIEMNLDWSSYAVYQQYFGFSREKAEEVGDFIPAKDKLGAKMMTDSHLLNDLEIFNLPLEEVPSKEQLAPIWFTFNLIRNFVFNKNLDAKLNPGKFISWTESVRERYPSHPYINFFLSLAYLLDGKNQEAGGQYNLMMKNLEDSHWKEVFSNFGFLEDIKCFPKDSGEASAFLEKIRRRYDKF